MRQRAGPAHSTTRLIYRCGRRFHILEDAGNYITKLSKAEHSAPERQDAMEALMPVATRGGSTMLARIGGAGTETAMSSANSTPIAKRRIGESAPPPPTPPLPSRPEPDGGDALRCGSWPLS